MAILLIAALKVIMASILALAASGALYQYVGTKLDEQKYPPIGTMVDIGGYKLHMIDSSSADKPGQNNNGPTVVMDAGWGCNSLDWQLVQPEIAKFTRVVSYDRAGYGWSDASPLSRTSENIAKELHTMLHNAGIPAPYILVGHSFGGINVRFFANKYPDEVVGVILVDSLPEKIFQKLPVFWYEKSMSSMMYLKNVMKSYFGISRIMSDLGIDKFHQQLKIYPNFQTYLSSFEQACEQAYFSKKITTKFIEAYENEKFYIVENAAQLQKAGGLLGDKPLIVLTPRTSWPEENDDFNKIWQELQAGLVTQSFRGKQIIVEKSNHMIPIEQPEIIAAAVEAMWRSRVESIREMVAELCNAKE